MLSVRKIRTIVLAPLLILSMLVAGCASTLRHDVTVFHDLPDAQGEKTFRFAKPDDKHAGLRYATYERIIRAELLAAGFSESDDPALEVEFDYSAKRKIIRYVEHGPVVSPYFAFGHRRGWGGFSVAGPLWWGRPGYYSEHDVERHERILSLKMTDLSTAERKLVYESTAVSRGNQPALVAALPLLMRATLADFPGRSGVARQIDLTIPDEQATAQVPEKPAKAPK